MNNHLGSCRKNYPARWLITIATLVCYDIATFNPNETHSRQFSATDCTGPQPGARFKHTANCKEWSQPSFYSCRPTAAGMQRVPSTRSLRSRIENIAQYPFPAPMNNCMPRATSKPLSELVRVARSIPDDALGSQPSPKPVVRPRRFRKTERCAGSPVAWP